MRTVMISIRPEWCDKIIRGWKTVELRKTAPNTPTPFRCIIYCTKGDPSDPHQRLESHGHEDGKIRLMNGHVIGEFICNSVEPVSKENRKKISEQSCVSLPDMYGYAGEKGLCSLKAWRISNLVIYHMPKNLDVFTPQCKYMMEDRGCDHNKVACSYQDFEHEPWPVCTLKAVHCRKRMTRPPQSWCYIA